MKLSAPLRVAVIGCGALAELYYAPALSLYQAAGNIKVEMLFDPDPRRTAKLKLSFGDSKETQDFDAILASEIDLAIVASPPRYHTEQTVSLLDGGIAVLCEKPMAATIADAEQMVQAAVRSKKLLAVGLFRRFFPANQMIRSIIQNQSFGKVRKFEFYEGGQFNWPAQSASFFQKTNSQGGVLADLGVHVLDLLIWWFGMPQWVRYEDDAMGGLEANCRVELEFAEGMRGTVRLSRDTNLPNRTVIDFERGWVRCKAATAGELEISLNGSPFVINGNLTVPIRSGQKNSPLRPALSYHQSFCKQMENVIAALRHEEAVFIPGEEGLLSMRLIEQCYCQRRMMVMPWLEESELLSARSLTQAPQ